MALSYSADFRKKVITRVIAGNSSNGASLKFDIAANTVRNWYRRYKSEGHYKEKPRIGKKSKINRIEFEQYVESNPNITLSAISK